MRSGAAKSDESPKEREWLCADFVTDLFLLTPPPPPPLTTNDLECACAAETKRCSGGDGDESEALELRGNV